MTRHATLLESPLLSATAIFTDAERVIADPVVRNRGTIGGALCQADPSEDLSAVCAAVGARLVIRDRTRRARGGHARVPPRPVRDRGRPGGDAGRDPRPATALRQRVPEGRPPRRGLGGRGRRRRARRPTTARSPTPGSRSPRSAGTSRARCGARARRRRSRPESSSRAAAQLAAAACEPVTDQRGSEGVQATRRRRPHGARPHGAPRERRTTDEGGVRCPPDGPSG